MVYETKKVGVRTKTTVAILYMRDIVDPKIVQDVKNKLDDLHIDGAFSATQLEELMEPTKALFPLMGYTGRADFTVNCMLNGRVALIVDGTPAALIAPANLFLLVKAPEDIHFWQLHLVKRFVYLACPYRYCFLHFLFPFFPIIKISCPIIYLPHQKGLTGWESLLMWQLSLLHFSS